MPTRPPLVAVPACRKIIDPHPFHCVGEKYLEALAAAAHVLPLAVPAFGDALPIAGLLGRIDGLMLTGSPSNVEPHRYGGAPSRSGTLHDPHRDATTLPLVRAAIAAGIPVLAVCRGFQEVNVALGGTLHQNVHELPGKLDHRGPSEGGVEVCYGVYHPVDLIPGGILHAIAGTASVHVNSLHEQGVERLAAGLEVEATAADGLIEAFRLADDSQFLLGIQWHPEWRVLDDPVSRGIFARFGDACRAYATQGLHGHHPQLV